MKKVESDITGRTSLDDQTLFDIKVMI